MLSMESHEFDKNEILWESGIPEACWDCYSYATSNGLLKAIASEIVDEVNADDEYDDGYHIIGVRLVGDHTRTLIEESGVEVCDDLLSYPTNKLLSEFVCID